MFMMILLTSAAAMIWISAAALPEASSAIANSRHGVQTRSSLAQTLMFIANER
jgi:hypothetical protein